MCDFNNIIFLLFSLAYNYLPFSLGVFARLADWRLRLTPFFFVLVHIDVEAHSQPRLTSHACRIRLDSLGAS